MKYKLKSVTIFALLLLLPLVQAIPVSIVPEPARGGQNIVITITPTSAGVYSHAYFYKGNNFMADMAFALQFRLAIDMPASAVKKNRFSHLRFKPFICRPGNTLKNRDPLICKFNRLCFRNLRVDNRRISAMAFSAIIAIWFFINHSCSLHLLTPKMSCRINSPHIMFFIIPLSLIWLPNIGVK